MMARSPTAPMLLAFSQGTRCVHHMNLAVRGVVLMQSRTLGRPRKISHTTIPLSFAFPGCKLGLGSFREKQGPGGTGRLPSRLEWNFLVAGF